MSSRHRLLEIRDDCAQETSDYMETNIKSYESTLGLDQNMSWGFLGRWTCQK